MADVSQAVQAAQTVAGLLQLAAAAGAVPAGTAGAMDLSNGLGALARCVVAIGIIQAATQP
jgi:hypothetical protein